MHIRRKISVAGAGLGAAAVLGLTLGTAPAGAASAPSTSPSVPHKYYPDAAHIPKCAAGNACAIVPYKKGFYVFKFHKYGVYSLRGWTGLGGLTNAQTGGAAVRVFKKNGSQISCYPAKAITYEVNWSPVWKVKLTRGGC